MQPRLSHQFETRKPSAIRMANIEFMKRTDKVLSINTAIGNVTLPMHPAMARRMLELKDSHFKDGVVKYSETVSSGNIVYKEIYSWMVVMQLKAAVQFFKTSAIHIMTQ